MRVLDQYKGLRKENYILFVGRIVTNMGSMIWPVLTLILTRKMGFSATEAAVVMILSGVLLVPAGMLGGKLADKYNKKNLIIICDLISIITYCICAFIPLSYLTIGLIVIAASCQSMEHPAYNALIADITHTKDRERAYSLQYLGSNIGLVASPTIAGVLFEKALWLAFLFSGIAIAISTVLIFLKVKNIEPVEEHETKQIYQKGSAKDTLTEVLQKNKVVLFYMLSSAIYYGAYLQYGYLMPLDLGRVHGDLGAVIYGTVSSINCIVVVICTPIFTRILRKTPLTRKNFMGNLFVMIGYAVFLLLIGHIPAYYLAIVLFTFGEVLCTISNGPYLTERIPATHRGRINGFMTMIQSVFQGIFMVTAGALYDHFGHVVSWIFVIGATALATVSAGLLIALDKKRYKELY